jgi:rhodanese-related sulfurtransferase
LNISEIPQKIAVNEIVLVDVRELEEWTETGVAASARLLPTKDFEGEQKLWRPFLESVGDRSLVLYCHSGKRAARVAAKLREKGYSAEGVGGFDDLQSAGIKTAAFKPTAP